MSCGPAWQEPKPRGRTRDHRGDPGPNRLSLDSPLNPSTMPPDKVKEFGSQVPMKRPGQPKELAPVYMMLAESDASYVSGATVAATGGKPFI